MNSFKAIKEYYGAVALLSKQENKCHASLKRLLQSDSRKSFEVSYATRISFEICSFCLWIAIIHCGQGRINFRSPDGRTI
jgi:hypothetical protein